MALSWFLSCAYIGEVCAKTAHKTVHEANCKTKSETITVTIALATWGSHYKTFRAVMRLRHSQEAVPNTGISGCVLFTLVIVFVKKRTH